MTAPYNHAYITTNGVKLHVVQAGPEDGPLVILLHGFPEFWYGMRHQIDYLASVGYRVWTPDQRGYNLSDKPQGVILYSRDELAKDVIGLIDAAGREKAYLVGHDWGAAVAWWTANLYPERLEKLVILNVPHHHVFMQTLRSNFRQLLKSWYIFYFQLPVLPEIVSRLRNWRIVVDTLIASSLRGTFTDEDLELYRQTWSQPGAFTAMVNWYRAAPRTKMPDNPRIHVPTLVIWGAKDQFVSVEMAQPSADLAVNGEAVIIPEATHWVQHEAADEVNRLIEDFFKRSS